MALHWAHPLPPPLALRVCVCVLVSSHTKSLRSVEMCVRRLRPGGEGACVTTLLEMPFGAQRYKTSDAMRDLVVSPAMGVSTLEPGVVWTRE